MTVTVLSDRCRVSNLFYRYLVSGATINVCTGPMVEFVLNFNLRNQDDAEDDD